MMIVSIAGNYESLGCIGQVGPQPHKVSERLVVVTEAKSTDAGSRHMRQVREYM